MNKLTKIVSVALSAMMIMSAVPATTASAATKVAKPKIKAENVNKGIKITWKKAKGAKKYVVMRKLSTGKKYIAIKTVNKAKAGSFIDKKAKAGKKYKYTVKAVNGKKSSTSKAQTIVRLTTPKVTKGKKYGYIKWNKVKGAKFYVVQHAEIKDGKVGKYYWLDTVKSTSCVEWDYSNNKVSYKVIAVSGKSKSAESKPITMEVFDGPRLFAELSSDYTGIDLSWYVDYDHSTFDGFRIYRSTDTFNWDLMVDLKKDDCIDEENSYEFDGIKMYDYKYKDTNVEEMVRYTYRIVAYKGNKVSQPYETQFVTYKSAAYIIKVGETVSLWSGMEGMEGITEAEIQQMIDEMLDMGYSISFASEDESIVTVNNEDFTITGVSEGTANITVTVTMQEDGTSMTITEQEKVKVVSADTVTE